MSAAIRRQSSTLRAIPLSGTRKPIFFMASRNSSRSSAFLITSRVAPIISTPNRSKNTLFGHGHGRVQTRSGRPAWAAAHPDVSRSIMAATNSGNTGSI